MPEVRNIIISLIVFSCVIIGITGFYGSLALNYGENLTDLKYFNATVETQAQIEGIRTSVDTSQVTGTFLDIPITIVSGVSNAFKLFYSSIDIFSNVLSDISTILGLPSWFITLIITIVSVVIIFEIMSAIMKYKL